MYEHADQSWRAQPKFMSEETIELAVARISEYAHDRSLPRLAIIFHGGEPLLFGADRLSRMAGSFRAAMPRVQVDFGVQTNGTLLDDAALDVLAAADIGVSISVDGPQEANDRHRLTTGGRSSHDATVTAIGRLRSRPDLFAGVIGVVDPANDPRGLLAFYDALGAPTVDLLLPDANHSHPPPGRDQDRGLYVNWLVRAFDVWFDEYPHMPVRTFEAVLDAIAGMPSQTDAFGFGDVSLLTIETDGSYHDLDVLKITADGATALGLHMRDGTVDDAAASPRIAAHRLLLSRDGLGEVCRACPEVGVCGGGAVAHRYDGEGYRRASTYCGEMLALIGHARKRMARELVSQRAAQERSRNQPRATIDLREFDSAEDGADAVQSLRARWMDEAEPALGHAAAYALTLAEGTPGADAVADAASELRCMPVRMRRELAVQPAAVVWAYVLNEHRAGRATIDLAGRPMPADPVGLIELTARCELLTRPRIRWHPDDTWLRRPFEDGRVVFDDEHAAVACELGRDAFALIDAWRPRLAAEMELLSRDVLFIQDLTAHRDKVVSFSDDSAPGALYCSMRRSDGPISAVDLADSLVHEHRHQKLYLLDRFVPVVSRDRPLVSSPWREDLRPPSGLLHAVFVFVELLELWRHIAAGDGPSHVRASREISTITGRLRTAFATLRQVALTEGGKRLVRSLHDRSGL
jgi:uncharacterized protein